MLDLHQRVHLFKVEYCHRNTMLYIKADVISVRLIVVTALMAISSKMIIFNFEKITPHFVVGTAAVVLALGITYWLITKGT